ncbi:uncharacterized protein LOC130823434 [Amaranthus tricolor]|uniref:uncharacterized protein LOC130823434 n=1 Tax=Amaranthus tricolor TaxID=29722 RepID=UPI002587EC74|nr:uncharacterized protein LOC130823434 [Amaranthus tricolor]
MYMSWYRRISILRVTNTTFAQPGSHYHPTSTLLAECIRSVLIQCNDTIQGAFTSPDDVGYRLCSQTLGSINSSLTDALSKAGYEYLTPTPPVIGEVDDTFHAPSPRSSAYRGSSSRGSSSRSTRGRQRSSTRGRSSRSPSTSGTISPFVPLASITTPPPHPSPPQRIITYQRASQRRAPALNVIAEGGLTWITMASAPEQILNKLEVLNLACSDTFFLSLLSLESHLQRMTLNYKRPTTNKHYLPKFFETIGVNN